MKVYNLACDRGHRFEGWFASEEEFLSQAADMHVECPICASARIARLPSAPHLNLAKSEAPAPAERQHRAQWLKMARQVVANTEDVGTRFAEEVRRIHYEEAEARGIRGVATSDEYHALAEEGIEVIPFPVPAVLKQTLQ